MSAEMVFVFIAGVYIGLTIASIVMKARVSKTPEEDA